MSKNNKDTSKKLNILIVDDEDALRYSIRRALAGRPLLIEEANSGEAALEIVQKTPPHIILLDNRMGGMTGIETLQHLKGICPKAKIIIMTAYTTTQSTIEAMKFGAFDYIMKPFDLDKILSLVDSAIDVVFQGNVDTFSDQSEISKAIIEEDLKVGIIGNSNLMQDVYKMIGQVSSTNVTVLITGESGTGKELVARSIHSNSLRSNQSFIAVNCSAIPENLIESELFGHEKGSFTGASQQRIGYFEECDRGTIFLDEIGDMPLPAQTKILRALQEGEIQRVGGNQTIKINVRIIAATNKSIESMVKNRTFREDLYYRLNVVRVQIPPLRERREDIPLLINYILSNLAQENSSVANKISDEALKALSNYSWPGNVRELENIIHRSSVLAQGNSILLKDLPKELMQANGNLEISDQQKGNIFQNDLKSLYSNMLGSGIDKDILKYIEKEFVKIVYEDCGGLQSRTSKILGISTSRLKKILNLN